MRIHPHAEDKQYRLPQCLDDKCSTCHAIRSTQCIPTSVRKIAYQGLAFWHVGSNIPFSPAKHCCASFTAALKRMHTSMQPSIFVHGCICSQLRIVAQIKPASCIALRPSVHGDQQQYLITLFWERQSQLLPSQSQNGRELAVRGSQMACRHTDAPGRCACSGYRRTTEEAVKSSPARGISPNKILIWTCITTVSRYNNSV